MKPLFMKTSLVREISRGSPSNKNKLLPREEPKEGFKQYVDFNKEDMDMKDIHKEKAYKAR